MKKNNNLLFGMSLKNYTNLDVALLKASVLAFGFFLVSVWPDLANWAGQTHWAWFLIATIIFAIRPCMKAFR